MKRFKKVEIVLFKPSKEKKDACAVIGGKTYYFEKVKKVR